MAQTVEELEARLALVRKAIERAIVGGKRTRVGSGASSQEIERQSLADLQAHEASLERQISRIQGGSAYYGIPTP